MSLKRILGLTISLLDLIVIGAMFLPYGDGISFFASSYAASIPLIVMNAIGFIMGVIGIKAEINYANTGATLFFMLYITFTSVVNNMLDTFLQNVGISFYIIFVASLFGIIGTLIYNLTADSSSKSKAQESPKITKAGGIQQRTNSLNMNMPVNNYQALPVTVTEKQKAPMNVLMGSNVVQGNSVQSHMTELGLTSINISQDNLTGAVQMPMNNEPQLQQIPPMQGAPVIMGVMPGAVPQMMPQASPMVQQPIPDQNIPGVIPSQAAATMQNGVVTGPQAPVAPAQMGKPDLLAGSQLSGQLDNAPYNSSQAQQGPGQFF